LAITALKDNLFGKSYLTGNSKRHFSILIESKRRNNPANNQKIINLIFYLFLIESTLIRLQKTKIVIPFFTNGKTDQVSSLA
jgi:hypothetical protein